MRKLIVLLLLAAAGYYLYTRHGASAGGGELPTEIAWREVTRDQGGAVTFVLVVAVSGDRWRSEAKSSTRPNTLVLVSDGVSAAASIPQAPAASLDPRPAMRKLLHAIHRGKPKATEQIDGRPYWRFSDTYNGISVSVWADPETRFPYRLRGTGEFLDVTYTMLPAPSERDRSDLFSTRALTPLLSRYLSAP